MFTPATMKPDEAATVGAYVERLQQQNAALLAALRAVWDNRSAFLNNARKQEFSVGEPHGVMVMEQVRAAIAACEGK